MRNTPLMVNTLLLKNVVSLIRYRIRTRTQWFTCGAVLKKQNKVVALLPFNKLHFHPIINFW